MLDKLPPELLRLVGEAACPVRRTRDVVIHGAVLDTSGHLVLCPGNPRRASLEAAQILMQTRAVCRFLRDELPNPRLKYRNVVGPGAEGHVVQSGTNTWLPEDVVFPQVADRSVCFTYEVRVEGQAEVIGGLSRSRARFGTGAEDALTWYLAPHRHDFGFRTRMFQRLAAGRVYRNNVRLVPGQWHHVGVIIERNHAQTNDGQHAVRTEIMYSLDGLHEVGCHVLSFSVGGAPEVSFDPVDRLSPGQRFGMVTYDTSYSWRNASILHGRGFPAQTASPSQGSGD